MTFESQGVTFWLLDVDGDNVALFFTPEDAMEYVKDDVDPEEWEETSCGWVALDYYGIEKIRFLVNYRLED